MCTTINRGELAWYVAEAAREYADALKACRCDPADGQYDTGCTLADARDRLRDAARMVLDYT